MTEKMRIFHPTFIDAIDTAMRVLYKIDILYMFSFSIIMHIFRRRMFHV